MSEEHDDLDRIPPELERVVHTADPVPLDVLEALRAIFPRRDLDAELAELVYDSLLDDLTGVRGTGTFRELTFEGTGATVDVAVTAQNRLSGQVTPPGRGQVELRHSGGSFTVEADELGHFEASVVTEGPVSLRWLPENEDVPVVVTAWVVL